MTYMDTPYHKNISYGFQGVQTEFFKLILNFKSSTPNCMVYGETGRDPIFVKIRMVMYWAKILTAHESKLTSVIYWYFYKIHVYYQWIKCVGDTLNSCGLSYLWINENFCSLNHLLKKILKTNLCKTWIQMSLARLNVLIIEFSKLILVWNIIC